GSTTAESAALR
nr:RecName: Full=Unknown protein 7 [Ginkgo biloba]